MNIFCIKIYAFKLHVQYSVQLYQFTGTLDHVVITLVINK